MWNYGNMPYRVVIGMYNYIAPRCPVWVVPVARKNVLPSSEAETLPLRWGHYYLLRAVGMTMNLGKGELISSSTQTMEDMKFS
jgi:hypothetical protein